MSNYNILRNAEPFVPIRPKITLKDHKTNFDTDPKVRLICSSKSDLGKLSKIILDKHMYEHYIKPNTNLKYIHFESNHLSYIKSALIKNVFDRISKLSSNKNIFY